MPIAPKPNESLQREDEVLDELEQRFEEAYDENGVARSPHPLESVSDAHGRVMAVEETLNALATSRRRATPEGA